MWPLGMNDDLSLRSHEDSWRRETWRRLKAREVVGVKASVPAPRLAFPRPLFSIQR